MKHPEPGTAEFINEAMEEAWAIIEPIMDDVAKRYITNRQTVGKLPPTWNDIQNLPENDAIATLGRMIVQPYWRRDGLAFTRKLLDKLEAQNGGNEPAAGTV